MTKGGIALIVLAIIVVIVFIYSYNKSKNSTNTGANADTEKVCFDLPTSSDPSTFGPKYWAAFHTLAKDIPCAGCRGFAEKFVVYMHDIVNKKLGKKIYDQANFDYFNKAISMLNTGMDINTAFSTK